VYGQPQQGTDARTRQIATIRLVAGGVAAVVAGLAIAGFWGRTHSFAGGVLWLVPPAVVIGAVVLLGLDRSQPGTDPVWTGVLALGATPVIALGILDAGRSWVSAIVLALYVLGYEEALAGLTALRYLRGRRRDADPGADRLLHDRYEFGAALARQRVLFSALAAATVAAAVSHTDVPVLIALAALFWRRRISAVGAALGMAGALVLALYDGMPSYLLRFLGARPLSRGELGFALVALAIGAGVWTLAAFTPAWLEPIEHPDRIRAKALRMGKVDPYSADHPGSFGFGDPRLYGYGGDRTGHWQPQPNADPNWAAPPGNTSWNTPAAPESWPGSPDPDPWPSPATGADSWPSPATGADPWGTPADPWESTPPAAPARSPNAVGRARPRAPQPGPQQGPAQPQRPGGRPDPAGGRPGPGPAPQPGGWQPQPGGQPPQGPGPAEPPPGPGPTMPPPGPGQGDPNSPYRMPW